MAKESAGILLYRIRDGSLEFLLAHPGGPFWKDKEDGAWTIPKGEIQPGEDQEAAARREFREELGFEAPASLLPLAPIRQKGGKLVHAYAAKGDCNPAECRSNEFEMEWPPKSGRKVVVPEVDRVQFFDEAASRKKMNPAQIPLLEELKRKIA